LLMGAMILIGGELRRNVAKEVKAVQG
jgi:hypothetical protein